MNPIHLVAMKLESAMRQGEPLDEFHAHIRHLNQLAGKDWRVPFEQRGSQIRVGYEWYPLLSGAAHYRTILMQRSGTVWYPDSNKGQISAFEVYCASQNDPSDTTPDGASQDDYEHDLAGFNSDEYGERGYANGSRLGATHGGSNQYEMQETGESSYRSISDRMDKLEELGTPEAMQEHGQLKAYLNSAYFMGRRKSIPGERRRIANRVRKNCEYFLAQLDKSRDQLSQNIADHLRINVKVGATCQYVGDWKFTF